MGCEICGRPDCTISFHSIEEQEAYYEIADNINDRIISKMKRLVNSLPVEIINEKEYIKLKDIYKIIDDLI